MLQPILRFLGCNSLKNIFTVFNTKDQIWYLRKIGQGQPKIIILTILVVLVYPVLRTKFQRHLFIGSREEDL